MNFNTALETLNIKLKDTDNFTFTEYEKTQALTEAWGDPYNTYNVWDESLTFSSSQYAYEIPEGITVVKGLYYKPSTDSFPTPLPSDVYEVVDENLYISPEYQYFFSDGQTIIVKGVCQRTITDPLSDDRKDYVLKLAQYNTLSMLGAQKANKFLKNDTSMAEIVAMRRELERELAVMRRKFNASTERA